MESFSLVIFIFKKALPKVLFLNSSGITVKYRINIMTGCSPFEKIIAILYKNKSKKNKVILRKKETFSPFW